MAAQHYQLTLGAAALRLSDVYGDGAGVINAAHDVPLRQVLLSASGADAFLGGDDTTTSTDYGVVVDSTALVPVTLGPFESGPVKLSDLYAAGAGATLHILVMPY